jgi:hypothetical protein
VEVINYKALCAQCSPTPLRTPIEHGGKPYEHYDTEEIICRNMAALGGEDAISVIREWNSKSTKAGQLSGGDLQDEK